MQPVRGEVQLWRAVPMALYAAFALDALNLALVVLVQRFHWFSSRLFLAWDGIAIASIVLAIYGSFELFERFKGLARAGALIAAIANIGMLVFLLVFATLFDLRSNAEPSSWLLALDRYGWIALFGVEAIGWMLAAWRTPVAAIPCGVAVLVSGLPAQLWDHLLGHSAGPRRDLVLRTVHWFALAVLVLFAARGASQVVPRRAAAGLRRAAASLTLRVVAAVVGTGTLMLVALGGHDNAGVLRFGMLGGAAIAAVALALFATGVLEATRAAPREMPRWLLAIAATGISWAFGVAVRQLPSLYVVLYRPDDSRHGDAMETAQALPIVALAVTTIALVALLIAIVVFAARRADKALAADVGNKGVIAVVMWCASAALTAWVLPTASESAALAVLVVAAGAMLAALLLFASLCRGAAAALDRGPTLPDARVVSR